MRKGKGYIKIEYRDEKNTSYLILSISYVYYPVRQ